MLLVVVSSPSPSRRIGVDQVVEVHQVQQQQRPMLELVQIWRLPSSLTPSLATCTTFLSCLACTAPACLHTSHKYNTSLLIGIFCCVLQDPLTSILPNPPLPSLLAYKKSEQSLNQNENKRISCSYCITFSHPLGSTPPCQPFAKAGSQRLSLLSGSLTVQPPQKPGRKFVWIK